MCSPALWGVEKGGAHKMDLKGVQGCHQRLWGTHLGTLRGAISSCHLRNDQTRAWVEVGEAAHEPIGIFEG